MSIRRTRGFAAAIAVVAACSLVGCSATSSAGPSDTAAPQVDNQVAKPGTDRAAAMAEVADHSLVAGPPSGSVNPPDSEQGLPPVLRHIKTTDKVVFMTMDDGYTKDARVMREIKESGIPVTPFLTKIAIADDKGYFRDISSVTGQHVQNHTLTHPQLPGLSQSGQQAQICGTSDLYADWFGTRPWMLRPPYGEYNQATQQAAKECGIDYIVLWNVSLPQRFLRYAQGDSLQPGDIILTHWRADLYKHLPKALRDIKRAGFKVAALQDYLPKKS